MKPDLVLVANATHARLFRRETQPTVLVPLLAEEHPEGRLKASVLADGPLGHGADDNRPGGTAFAPRVDAHRKEHLAFARQLSQQVDELLASGDYGSLKLFSSSPFLGELKAALSPRAAKALQAVDIDLTSFGLAELEQRVEAALKAKVAG